MKKGFAGARSAAKVIIAKKGIAGNTMLNITIFIGKIKREDKEDMMVALALFLIIAILLAAILSVAAAVAVVAWLARRWRQEGFPVPDFLGREGHR